MASLNRPDKLQLDAYADPQLQTGSTQNGWYYRWTNRLTTPILNCKAMQLLNANFVNSTLQLNDNANLMFFYYATASPATALTLSALKCIRLMPSNFVGNTNAYSAFTQNKYFNSGTELATALTAAASAGGDDVTYNPTWVAGQVTFSYDTARRRIGIAGNGTTYIAPAAADDPNVLDFLRGTTNPNNRPRMNTHNSGATYASAPLQPYVEGRSMNARLGFAMSYNTNGIWWNSSSLRGCANATGVPHTSAVYPVYGDASPILLGTQNVGVYLSIATGGGLDAYNRKNLSATIPISVAPLNINTFVTNSLQTPCLSTPSEIYEITVELLDDYGQPFYQPPNYNTEIAFGLLY
jgi:hypothetical protein